MGPLLNLRKMIWLIFCCATLAASIPAKAPNPQETDSEQTRKLLGSSVVTSVSVIMDHGNGTKTYISDGQAVPKPHVVGTPGTLMSPDRYEFYSFDEGGELVKKLMTLEQIQELIAGGDELQSEETVPVYYHQPLIDNTDTEGVHKVLASVQNVLKGELEASKYHGKVPMPIPDDSWSIILPGILKPEAGIKHDQTSKPPTANPRPSTTTRKPQYTPTVPTVSTVTRTTNKYSTYKVPTYHTTPRPIFNDNFGIKYPSNFVKHSPTRKPPFATTQKTFTANTTPTVKYSAHYTTGPPGFGHKPLGQLGGISLHPPKKPLGSHVNLSHNKTKYTRPTSTTTTAPTTTTPSITSTQEPTLGTQMPTTTTEEPTNVPTSEPTTTSQPTTFTDMTTISLTTTYETTTTVSTTEVGTSTMEPTTFPTSENTNPPTTEMTTEGETIPSTIIPTTIIPTTTPTPESSTSKGKPGKPHKPIIHFFPIHNVKPQKPAPHKPHRPFHKPSKITNSPDSATTAPVSSTVAPTPVQTSSEKPAHVPHRKRPKPPLHKITTYKPNPQNFPTSTERSADTRLKIGTTATPRTTPALPVSSSSFTPKPVTTEMKQDILPSQTSTFYHYKNFTEIPLRLKTSTTPIPFVSKPLKNETVTSTKPAIGTKKPGDNISILYEYLEAQNSNIHLSKPQIFPSNLLNKNAQTVATKPATSSPISYTQIKLQDSTSASDMKHSASPKPTHQEKPSYTTRPYFQTTTSVSESSTPTNSVPIVVTSTTTKPFSSSTFRPSTNLPENSIKTGKPTPPQTTLPSTQSSPKTPVIVSSPANISTTLKTPTVFITSTQEPQKSTPLLELVPTISGEKETTTISNTKVPQEYGNINLKEKVMVKEAEKAVTENKEKSNATSPKDDETKETVGINAIGNSNLTNTRVNETLSSDVKSEAPVPIDERLPAESQQSHTIVANSNLKDFTNKENKTADSVKNDTQSTGSYEPTLMYKDDIIQEGISAVTSLLLEENQKPKLKQPIPAPSNMVEALEANGTNLDDNRFYIFPTTTDAELMETTTEPTMDTTTINEKSYGGNDEETEVRHNGNVDMEDFTETTSMPETTTPVTEPPQVPPKVNNKPHILPTKESKLNPDDSDEMEKQLIEIKLESTQPSTSNYNFSFENNSTQEKTTAIPENEKSASLKPNDKFSANKPGYNIYQPSETLQRPAAVDLHPAPHESMGLEASTAFLSEDVRRFSDLCNELAFRLWASITGKGQISSRSLVLSPFATTSLLAMVFLGARGPTSGQMNDVLRLDDMVTFNPHQVFRNVTESVINSKTHGVATASFVRELYSDKVKGKILDFYKERVQQYYDGHVEEVSFSVIGDVIRRRTNLLIKRQTLGKVPEYLRGASLNMRPPLAAFSANIFQTDCELGSTEGRDGEMYFVVRPSTRQRRLVPVPAVVWRSGFLAGYEPSLDATSVCLGSDALVSTILVLPGQQGQVAPGDGLARLEQRLIETSYRRGGWSRLLRSLLPRPGLELQLPRFSHRSVLNVTGALQRMGLKDLFSKRADLRGLNGISNDLHLSDMIQVNTFSTCGEETAGARHHIETYPASPQRMGREEPEYYPPPDFDAAFSLLPLALRPRQARLPDNPRLRFDRPFLYMVRHNPTGMILHMGRFNPRLLP